MALKRRTPPSDKTPPLALYAPYDVLGEGTLLAEHLSATMYDDKTIRTPGSIRIENMGPVYRVTVYDHDAGLRLAVSAPTVSDALEIIEQHLGAADAPWEIDRYLSEQASKRVKKKK
jgi:hypothetical protein